MHNVDARLICANLVLLLVASLFPWPTSVISAAVRSGDRSDEGPHCSVCRSRVSRAAGLDHLVRLPGPRAPAAQRRNGHRVCTQRDPPIAAVVAFVEPVVALVAFAALPLFFIGTLLFPARNA